MQAFPEKYQEGMFAAARDIISSEGLLFLLAGLGYRWLVFITFLSIAGDTIVTVSRTHNCWLWIGGSIKVWLLRDIQSRFWDVNYSAAP